METVLAILMVLGIFVGIPALIGFVIAGAYILKDHRVRTAERAKALEEAAARALQEEITEPAARTLVGMHQKR